MRHLRRLHLALLLPLLAGCENDPAGCQLLGGVAIEAVQAPGSTALDIPEPQVLIEARFIGASTAFLEDLGVALPFQTPILGGNGGTLGASSGDPRNVIVSSNVVGGAFGANYLLPQGHPRNSFLGVVNEQFVSPFEDVKIFPMAPLSGCIEFADSVVTEPTDFPAGSFLDNLGTYNPGFGGGSVFFNRLEDLDAQTILDAFRANSENAVLDMPVVQLFSGQRSLLIAQDVTPAIGDLEPAFRDRVQNVVSDPLGIFSGPVLELKPTILPDGSISLEIRLATKAISFYRSDAFGVGGQGADLEIPLAQPSENHVQVTVADGETLLLGRHIRPNEAQTREGIPGLHAIPILGSLFRSKFKEDQSQELVILVTPRLVNPD